MAGDVPKKISLTKRELSQGAESYIEITDKLFKKLALCKGELQTASFIADNLASIDEPEVRKSIPHFSELAKSTFASAQSDYSEFIRTYKSFPNFAHHSSQFKAMLDCFAGKLKTLKDFEITTPKVTYKFIDLFIRPLA